MRMPFRLVVTGAALVTIVLTGPALARPISLAEALERAQASSPRLEQARALLAAAAGRARQAGVAPNPELSVELENFGGNNEYRGTRSVEATVSVEQTLELGGKRGARRAAAQADVQAAELRLALARADVGRDVRTSFAELSAASERLALAEAAAQRTEALARSAQSLVDAGREPPLRALRAQAALARARADSEGARSALSAAQRALGGVLGASEDGLTPIPTTDVETVATDIDPMSSLEVRLSRAERDAAAARVRLEETTATPDVTAGAGVRRIEETGDTAFVAGLKVPIPVRDRNRGAIAAARAELQAAEAMLAQARLDAARGIRDAQSTLAAATARLTALQTSGIAQAQEALRLARLGYEAGKFSLIEVLDAEEALADTQSALTDARLARAQAVAALARAAAQ